MHYLSSICAVVAVRLTAYQAPVEGLEIHSTVDRSRQYLFALHSYRF